MNKYIESAESPREGYINVREATDELDNDGNVLSISYNRYVVDIADGIPADVQEFLNNK